MRSVVINLDRATARLDHITRVFGEAGLTFERVKAISAEDLSQDEIERHGRGGNGMWITPPEIACTMSHRKCWRLIANGGDDYVAVFEDDAHLGRNAAAILGDAGWIPKDADLVRLETVLQRCWMDAKGAASIDGREVRRLRGTHLGGAGYILSKKAAGRLLSETEDFVDIIDILLFNEFSERFASLLTYQMHPALCLQDMFLVKADGGSEAMASALHHARKGRQWAKRRGFAKLKRELERPVRQLHRKVRSLLPAEWGGWVYETVPFE